MLCPVKLFQHQISTNLIDKKVSLKVSVKMKILIKKTLTLILRCHSNYIYFITFTWRFQLL